MPLRVNSDQNRIMEISGTQLTTTEVAAVAREKLRVRLSQERDVRKKILASRQLLEEKLRPGEIICGVNTGLGGNVRFILPAKDLTAHQENIFHFLICGTGNPLPEDAVRPAILLSANALAKGYSAVRMVVIERLIDLLNHYISPYVPSHGSVDATTSLNTTPYIVRIITGQVEL